MIIIDGKALAKTILAQQKIIMVKNNLHPKLVTFLIGDNESSKIYIHEKQKKAKKMGVLFENIVLPEDTDEEKVYSLIKKCNEDPTVSGILVQFPLPEKLNAHNIISSISPYKDADGFHEKNIEKFLNLNDTDNILEQNLLLPVTPSSVFYILNTIPNWREKVQTIGIIGKQSPFITPLIHYFSRMNQTDRFSIKIINPQLDKLKIAEQSLQCDLLIAACGKAESLKRNMIKDQSIVIDVGITRKEGKVVGDIDFTDVAPKTSYITPVTGGVGPVTVAILMRNVVFAALHDKSR